MSITNKYGVRTDITKDFVLKPKQYSAFQHFENDFPYSMHYDQTSEEFTIGFREFNQSKTLINHLFSHSIDLSHDILLHSMNTSYREFEDYLSTVVEKNLKTITLNSAFDRIYGVFQLKENYELFSDIEYYELCYSTNWTASGHAYYLFRFYLDDIEPSCVLEDKHSVSNFPYHSDPQEAVRPKIIISTHYKNLQPINRLFLFNYKRDLPKKFECLPEEVNDDILDVFDMTLI